MTEIRYFLRQKQTKQDEELEAQQLDPNVDWEARYMLQPDNVKHRLFLDQQPPNLQRAYLEASCEHWRNLADSLQAKLLIWESQTPESSKPSPE